MGLLAQLVLDVPAFDLVVEIVRALIKFRVRVRVRVRVTVTVTVRVRFRP